MTSVWRLGLFAPFGLIGALASPGNHPYRRPLVFTVSALSTVTCHRSTLVFAHFAKWTQEDLKTSSPPSRVIG
jgi:hypothetical protein